MIHGIPFITLSLNPEADQYEIYSFQNTKKDSRV